MPRKKAAPTPVQPPAPMAVYVPPPYEPPPPYVRAGINTAFKALQTAIDRILLKYGGTRAHLETRHLESIDRVLDARTIEEAEQLAHKAEDKVFITMLRLNHSGKIIAKTPEAYLKRSYKAEGFAERLWKQYLEAPCANDKETAKKAKLLERYNRQMDRVNNLREYSIKLRDNPSLPPFEELYKLKDEGDDDADVPVVVKPDEPTGPRDAGKTPKGRRAVRAPPPQERPPRPAAKAALRRVRQSRAAKKGRKHR